MAKQKILFLRAVKWQEGNEEQKLAKFREIRDSIDQKVKNWLAGMSRKPLDK